MPLAGRPMVEWSIMALRACEAIGSIVVACPPGHIQDLGGGSDVAAVEGGATRSQSVSNALEAVETELVAIHDAARPLVTPELIDGVVATLLTDPGAAAAIAATPVTDTIKQVAGAAIESTLDRGRLWAAQTPQVLRTEALRRALDAYPDDAPPATDEAMLVEATGGKVLIHPAPPGNFKVTRSLDLRLAALLLTER